MSGGASETPTCYAVRCRTHELVYLTYDEYERQMDRPGSLWRCPRCSQTARWDDDTYEACLERSDESL